MDRHLTERIRQLPGFVDVTNNLNNRSPVVALDIDRDKLASARPQLWAGRRCLQSAFSARQVSTIYGSTNQYQVILEVAPEYQLRSGIAVPPLRAQPAAASWCRSTPWRASAARRRR
jgi:multidrug efflux pump subunit AcrB